MHTTCIMHSMRCMIRDGSANVDRGLEHAPQLDLSVLIAAKLY